MLHLTHEGDRRALVDRGDVAMSDLDSVLARGRPLEDHQAGGRGRGCQPPELHHATPGREEVKVGDLALEQPLVLQLDRGYVQHCCDPSLLRLIDLAQRQPLLEAGLNFPDMTSESHDLCS